MYDLLAVLVSLALLMYLAFRGMTLILLGPAAALLAVALTGSLPILASYTQIFMGNAGQFIIAFFPLFMLGAIFGRLMDDTGSAQSIARSVSGWLGRDRAIASVVICCAVLTYGGVSAFVVAFAVFPLAAALFRDAGIPKRLIPGAIALGAFSFTMTALPGTPAIQNAIPMPFFGTTAFSAPGLGILASIIMFLLGMAWLNRRAAQARAKGEGYGGLSTELVPEPDIVMREHAQTTGYDLNELPEQRPAAAELPPFWLAILPIVVVIVANLVFTQVIVPLWDTSFLAEPLFGATTIESVRGIWAVIVGLFLAILLLIFGNWRRLTDLRASLDQGTDASVLPIFNTASLVGFGAVIAALPVFSKIADAVLTIGGGSALVSVAGSVAILSAITGSASGGMSIALESLGPSLVAMAQANGTSLDAMHRITALASGALDVLPHSGAVITLLAVCGVTHAQSYFDVMMTSLAAPFIALVVTILVASLVGSF
jgi:H+/gluconate symporter and related permeases